MKKISFIHERQIWLVNLDPTEGIELRKVRPCLVLRKFSPQHFIILPFTSKEKHERISFFLEDVPCLPQSKNYINISQIRTTDKSRFIRKYGEISEAKFATIKIKTAEVLKLLPQKAYAHNSS